MAMNMAYKCAMVKSRYIGDGRPPTFDRNPYNGYIKPYYWVDDHPLLYGNNVSLDPSTNGGDPITTYPIPGMILISPILPCVPYIFGTCRPQAVANISGNETIDPWFQIYRERTEDEDIL